MWEFPLDVFNGAIAVMTRTDLQDREQKIARTWKYIPGSPGSCKTCPSQRYDSALLSNTDSTVLNSLGHVRIEDRSKGKLLKFSR